MDTLILVAFIAGVVTVASPCVLTVLPLVLSTAVGGGRFRPLGIVLGLAVSFTFFTLIIAGAVQALALPAVWLRTFVILMLLLFGLTMLIPSWGRASSRLLAPLSRFAGSGSPERSGFGGGLLVGSGLGLLWAPCVGPIMGFVIGLTATRGITGQGLAITLAYTLGAGLPMLLVAYGTRGFAARLKRLRPHSTAIQRAFGALTVLVTVGLLFGLDVQLQAFAQRSLPPAWSSALTSVELQDSVQQEITDLDNNLSVPTETGQSAAEKPESTQPQATELEAVKPQSVETNVAAPPTPAELPTATPQPTAEPTPGLALADMGAAPELVGLTGWFNTGEAGKALTLEGLRGKVVIIDFWTFGCYNCRNTRPHVRTLYDKYKEQGLEIIGVHAPEFAYERVPENVQSGAREQGVTWPVALDQDFKTWRAYKNRYWPAFYFIDATGHIRHRHFGEGNYEYNEQVVQQLLAEAKP